MGNSSGITGMKKVINIISIVFCVFLTMIITVNVTMIVKSYIYPDKVPDFMGYKPFIVLSGSMEPTISTGDLVLTKEVAPEQINIGDIITFRVEGNTMVTHRVTDIVRENNSISFLTIPTLNCGFKTPI